MALTSTTFTRRETEKNEEEREINEEDKKEEDEKEEEEKKRNWKKKKKKKRKKNRGRKRRSEILFHIHLVFIFFRLSFLPTMTTIFSLISAPSFFVIAYYKKI